MTDVMTSLLTDPQRSDCSCCALCTDSISFCVVVSDDLCPVRSAADLGGLIRDIWGRGFSSAQQLARTSCSLLAPLHTTTQQTSFQAHCAAYFTAFDHVNTCEHKLPINSDLRVHYRCRRQSDHNSEICTSFLWRSRDETQLGNVICLARDRVT